jgi:hypothetical protein
VFACLESTSTPGSRAAIDQASSVNGPGWRGSAAVRNVYEDLYFVVLAGLDHSAALARAVRRDPSVSVALATLTRGSVEALGRVFWVITAESPLQLVERYSNIAYADLEDLAKVRPNETLQTRSGDSKGTPGAIRQRICDYLDGQGLPKPKRQGATTLVTDLLSIPVPDLPADAPRGAYNDLSAVAHGHPFAVTGFIDESAPGYLLRISDEMKTEYTSIAQVGVTRIGDAYLHYFQPSEMVATKWTTARDRSSARRTRVTLG